MDLVSIILISLSLSMDAFAVSICKGLSVRRVEGKHLLAVGLYFGGFQGLMPILGYFLGTTFASLIQHIAPYLSFGLLALIGGNMIREALSREEEEVSASFGVKTMLTMAVATSIDAFAVGVTFAANGADIWLSAGLIAMVTFVMSPIGLLVGNTFGAKYKDKAELAGGVVLVAIGIKMLLEGLGLL